MYQPGVEGSSRVKWIAACLLDAWTAFRRVTSFVAGEGVGDP